MSARGHRQVEHTADLALELWAEDEAALLAEAARAVTEIMTEGAELQARDARTFALDCLDAEDRLVQWINEVIYAAVTQGFCVAEVELSLAPERLSGTMRGEAQAAGRLRGELKAATYHELRLELGGPGARAFVVIDV